MNRKTVILAIFAGLLLAGCTPNETNGSDENSSSSVESSSSTVSSSTLNSSSSSSILSSSSTSSVSSSSNSETSSSSSSEQPVQSSSSSVSSSTKSTPVQSSSSTPTQSSSQKPASSSTPVQSSSSKPTESKPAQSSSKPVQSSSTPTQSNPSGTLTEAAREAINDYTKARDPSKTPATTPNTVNELNTPGAPTGSETNKTRTHTTVTSADGIVIDYWVDDNGVYYNSFGAPCSPHDIGRTILDNRRDEQKADEFIDNGGKIGEDFSQETLDEFFSDLY